MAISRCTSWKIDIVTKEEYLIKYFEWQTSIEILKQESIWFIIPSSKIQTWPIIIVLACQISLYFLSHMVLHIYLSHWDNDVFDRSVFLNQTRLYFFAHKYICLNGLPFRSWKNEYLAVVQNKCKISLFLIIFSSSNSFLEWSFSFLFVSLDTLNMDNCFIVLQSCQYVV